MLWKIWPAGRGQVAGQVRGGAGGDHNPQGTVARNVADGNRVGQARAGDTDHAVGGSRRVQGDIACRQTAGIEVRVGIGHRVGDRPAAGIGCRGRTDRDRGGGIVHRERRAGVAGRGQVAGQVGGGAGGDRNPQGPVARNVADGNRVGQARAGDTDRAVGGSRRVQGDIACCQTAGIEVRVGIRHRVGDGPAAGIGYRRRSDRDRGAERVDREEFASEIAVARSTAAQRIARLIDNGIVIHEVQSQRAVARDVIDGHRVGRAAAADGCDRAGDAVGCQREVGRQDVCHALAESDEILDAGCSDDIRSNSIDRLHDRIGYAFRPGGGGVGREQVAARVGDAPTGSADGQAVRTGASVIPLRLPSVQCS